MPKIYFLKGLPASWKSTWAKEEVAKNPHGTVRVNKDDLRAMCHGSVWGKDNEILICKIRDSIILESLNQWKNVIVDDTNFSKEHFKRVREVADMSDSQYTLETKFFDVPVEECIERDSKREKPVWEKVIRDMYMRFLWRGPENTPLLEQDKTLPKAVIVDIDGTVAMMNWRSPYDYTRVSEDAPHHDIVELVLLLQSVGYEILFVSGRKALCREATEIWLLHEWFSPLNTKLFMRAEEDNRKDTIIKKEIYEKYIKDNYYVKYVLDDRDQVVKGWRELWLRCLQVADGNF